MAHRGKARDNMRDSTTRKALIDTGVQRSSQSDGTARVGVRRAFNSGNNIVEADVSVRLSIGTKRTMQANLPTEQVEHLRNALAQPRVLLDTARDYMRRAAEQYGDVDFNRTGQRLFDVAAGMLEAGVLVCRGGVQLGFGEQASVTARTLAEWLWTEALAEVEQQRTVINAAFRAHQRKA